MVKMFVRDKRSSLLRKFVNYGGKKFYNNGLRLERLGSDKHSSLSDPLVSYEENGIL
jgi:hypothetical protein